MTPTTTATTERACATDPSHGHGALRITATPEDSALTDRSTRFEVWVCSTCLLDTLDALKDIGCRRIVAGDERYETFILDIFDNLPQRR